MRHNWPYFSTSMLLALLCATVSLAAPPPSRFSANGYASDYAVGEMDWMIPISGDTLRHTYFNPAIAYGSDNQGYADLGLGHRWIQNNKTLLGVYLFGGYTRVEHHAHLWAANPGVEAMGRRWDAHLNGYLSMGDKNYHYFDGLDIYSFFRSHSFFHTEQPFNLVHHTGNGADLKFGYQLFSNVPLRGYLGGYYFHAKEVNNLGGGAVGLEYWFDDHIKSFARYTYDNIHHSTGAIGLGIELGGTHYHRSNPCIEERLTDPVERYLDELGHGSAFPGKTKKNFIGNPYSVEILNNIAFFSQGGSPNNGSTLTLANCTFETPCGPNDFIQTSVNQLNTLLPNTIMYFNGGNYPALNSTLNGSIPLRTNQSIYSRNSDYAQPALAAERSHFLGGFLLEGNNVLSRIVLLPTPETNPQGIGYQNISLDTHHILIEYSQIGDSSNLFKIAIDLNGISSSYLNNNEVFSNFQAVAASNSSHLLIENSILNVINSKTNASTTAVLAGSNSSVQLNNVNITVTGDLNGSLTGFLTQTGTITANNVDIYTNNVKPTASSFAINNTGAYSSVLVSNSHLNINGQADTRIFNDGSSPPGVTITDSICQLNGITVPCM
jgi:hypothetical protein